MKRKYSISSFSKLPKIRHSKSTHLALQRVINKNIQLSGILKLISDKDVNLVRLKTRSMIRLFNQAVEHDNVALAQLILEKKPKIKKECLTKELLFWLLENNNLAMAKLFIKSGTSVNVTNSEGFTLLQTLVSSTDCKKHELAVLAMKRGAIVNTLDKNKRTSVFHEAIKSKCPRILQRLIERGADPNTKNSNGQTALFCACRSSAATQLVVPFVTSLGYKIVPNYLRDRRSVDALCYLIKMGSDKIPAMEAIVQRNSRCVDQANRMGETPLNCAIKLQKVKKIKYLIDCDANVNLKDKFGHRPLWIAASLPSFYISALLVSRGADVHARNKDLQYPLHAACKNSSMKNIKLLLRLGASLNVTNRNGYTPFSMMKNPTESEAGYLVIKYFALLTLMGENIHEMDLLAIYFDEKTLYIYEKSLTELAKMTEIEICPGIKYDVLYAKSVKELSLLARNEDFVSNFNRGYKLFPTVFSEMLLNMKMALRRRNIFVGMEQQLIDVFGNRLPRTFLRSLAEYLCYDILASFDRVSRYIIV